jgi:two-component system, NarL family, response regulator NreC
MSTITILLADDHRLVRQGIRSLLEGNPDFEVIGEVSDGLQALDAIEKNEPDVVLMDVMMPNLNGLDAARILSRRKVRTKVIMLSMYANSTYAVRALKSGAVGYVLKDSDLSEIEQAIYAAHEGRPYLSPQLSADVLNALVQYPDKADDDYAKLTVRERQVLQMIAEGMTNAAIAEKLVISTRTVEAHRANLMHKLNINSQAELVRFAVQQGLVS